MKNPVRAALRGRPGPASQEFFSEEKPEASIPLPQRGSMFVEARGLDPLPQRGSMFWSKYTEGRAPNAGHLFDIAFKEEYVVSAGAGSASWLSLRTYCPAGAGRKMVPCGPGE